MKIRTKIFLLLGLTLALMILVTAAGLWQINVIGKEITILTRLSVPLSETMNTLTFHSLEQVLHFERAINHGRHFAQSGKAKNDLEKEKAEMLNHSRKTTQLLAQAQLSLGDLELYGICRH